ncbi:MAG TPA: chemotaxis protein CheW [Sphingomonadaceae bacterium]|nr:chemotaxis protein CheW [Sphingomonadaceae bacterium]
MTLYLIVMLAGERVVLPADHIDSVVEIESVTPVPLAAPHIAGLAAMRSRVLTIVDSLAALGRAVDTPRSSQAVVVTVEGHLYGLQVCEVEDVVECPAVVQPLNGTLEPGWARVALGMIEIAGDALLLVDPVALVAGPPALAA